MAKVATLGFTDTPVDGVTGLQTDIAVINWAEDFRILSNSPENGLVLANITAPFGQPETWRFKQRDVKNVYAGYEGDMSVALDSKRGIATTVVLNESVLITDQDDPSYQRVAPVQGLISFTTPVHEAITADLLLDLFERLLAGMFEQGVVDESWINAATHGIVRKQALKG